MKRIPDAYIKPERGGWAFYYATRNGRWALGGRFNTEQEAKDHVVKTGNFNLVDPPKS